MATDDPSKTQKPGVRLGNDIHITDPAGPTIPGGAQLVQFYSDDVNENRTFIILLHKLRRGSVLETIALGATKLAVPPTPPTYSNPAVEFPDTTDLDQEFCLQVVSLEVTSDIPPGVELSVVASKFLTIPGGGGKSVAG